MSEEAMKDEREWIDDFQKSLSEADLLRYKSMDVYYLETERIFKFFYAQAYNKGLSVGAETASSFCNDSFKVVSAEYEKSHNNKIATAIKAKMIGGGE